MITCPEKANNNNNNNNGSNSNLVLAITLPIVCTMIISAIVAVICLRRQKNQKNRLSGFLKHLRGQTNSQKMWSIHIKQNDSIRAEDPDSLHRWEIPAKCLDFGGNRLIGSGAFSKVYKATISGRIPLLDMNQSLNLLSAHFQGGKYEVAVKRLPPHANQQNRADFFQEIEFMKTLGYHSHVISLIACVSDSFDPLIVVQYCANGDLLKYIRKNKTNFIPDSSIEENTEGALRSKDLLSIAWQISDGMDFLSTNNVVHRDLAARNILLTGDMVAKVADFGLCRYANEELYTSRRGRMPIKWMAPESLQYYEYSTKTDVWSFSILLFELYTLGEGPFQGIEPIEMVPHLKAGNRLSKPEYCSEEIFDLMKKCWAEDPSDRPNFHEVKEDLSCLMNSNDQHYGYLTLNEDEVATTDEMEEEPEKQITPPNNSTGEHTESCLI